MKAKRIIKKGKKFVNKNIVTKPRNVTYINYFKDCKVEPGTVLYQAYANKILAGNPYAIFLNLIENPEYSHLKHIWIIKDKSILKYPDVAKYANHDRVRFVMDGSDEALKALCTAQYLVNNAAWPSYYIKKDDQVYINTWHGTPLKGLGKFDKTANRRPIMSAQRNFLCADYLVMPNRYTTDILMEHYDIRDAFRGNVIEEGYPRIDLVANTDRDEMIKRLEEKTGTSLDGKKIILYAPTFRSEMSYAKKHIDNSDEICEYIQHIVDNMPDNYVMFFKAHSNLIAYFKDNSKITDLFLFDDFETNKVLSVTDVLITDYSSVFFDYLRTKRPIIFFTYDREKYEGERGFLFSLDEVPGRLCDTEKEVVESLEQINAGEYSYDEKYNNFLEKFAYKDDGGSTQRVVDIIFGGKDSDALYQPAIKKKSILVHVGTKMGKESLAKCVIDYLKSIDTEKYNVFLFGNYFEKQRMMFDEACSGIRYITTLPPTSYTITEAVNKKVFGPNAINIYEREYQRNLGKCKFDIIVNFASHMPVFRKMLETQTDSEHIIYVDSKYYTKNLISDLCKYPYKKIVLLEGNDVKCDSLGDSRVEIKKIDDKKDNIFDYILNMDMPLKILFIACFDSTNYVFVNVLKELEKRGHLYKILIRDLDDEANNLMFAGNPNIVSIENFDYTSLGEYDFVVSSPIQFRRFRKLYREINKLGLFTYTFSTLFSSITMRVAGDAVITIGENKFKEFDDNYLRYNLIAAGNPQYDSLVENRRPDIANEDIKKILFLEQGAYPCGDKGKQQLADLLVNMAKTNPDKEIHIKPRYMLDNSVKSIHTVSEHLYNYLEDVPDNLVLINEPLILEEILPQYDAMITMWSTAFIDAIAMNMPLMLIGGFDSDDVFDIRTNRVRDAYDELAESGVLVDFKDVMDKPLEFRPVDKTFIKKEFYNFDKPCSPYVVDIFEMVNKKLIIPNLRYTGFFKLDYLDFEKYLDTAKLYHYKSEEYRKWKKAYNKFNAVMQEKVYINRCMGNELDLSGCVEILENFDPYAGVGIGKLLNEKFDEIESDYFNNPANIEKAKKDKILLDFYFDWLFRNHRYLEIENFTYLHDEAKEDYEYYTAIRYLNMGRQSKAFEHITNYLGYILAKNKKAELLKEKRMYDYLKPFIGYTVRLNFIKYLYEHKKIEELMLLSFTVLDRDPLTAYYKMKALNEQGDYEKALEVYQKLIDSPETEPSTFKIFAEKVFANKVEIEYNYANEKLKETK
ncbi:MAG: CDP-glycerol glycerophosphotransferase family protein [Eubacterium sp.]|nr:CDP-glycerol glycerophosphotransferase family protein [Eubacterium sp.]